MTGKKNQSFSFKFIDRKKIFNDLQKLKIKKACHGRNIPVKIIKENINESVSIYSKPYIPILLTVCNNISKKNVIKCIT